MRNNAERAGDRPVPSEIRLEDIVDMEAIRQIAEDFHALTGHVVSITDLEGGFVVQVGWIDACTKFHRADPRSCDLCRQSDIDMIHDVGRGETRAYHCKNGLWHVVSPLYVADVHAGNIFTSQFFYDDEQVDLASFEARAERFGYERDAYLAAIEAVPRYSHDEVAALMRFLVGLAGQIAALGLNRLQLADTMAARIDSEMRFAALLEGAPIPVAVAGPDGAIEYLNDEFTRVFGYTNADIPHVDAWYALAYPDAAYRAARVAEWVAESIAAAKSDGRIPAHEYEVACKGGGVRTVVISGAVVGDRTLALFEDITERRKAEDALRLSEAKYSAAYRTSPDSVNINRLSDGLYVEVNEGFTALTGYTAGDVRGKTSAEINIWADASDRERLVAGLRADGLVSNMEAQFRRKDGSLTTALMSARVMEIDGTPSILSVTRDIAERKRSEMLLRESQRVARVGHYEWDIVHDNWVPSEVLSDIFGIDDSYVCDLEGFLGIVHPDDRRTMSRYVTGEVVAKRKPFDKQYRIIRVADGAERWVHGLGAVTFDESGAPISLFGIIQDITESKASADAVSQGQKRLERMVYDVAEAMGRVAEARDPYTQGHQRRVAEVGKRIAARMGLSKRDIDEVEMAGLLHDVGKLRIPTEILTKPGALSPTEYALVKDHPARSEEILRAIDFPWAVADIALQHQERLDGSGYPAGLKGDEILLAARILAVADVVEAMASHRPYRPALGIDAAIDEITGHPELYDAAAVAACVSLNADGELGL
jgi:PAS domain S-box-containing protein